MKILRMKATFGKLEGAELVLQPGLNIIEAPNESGKSTWCALIRAMFYGIPTRERDTKTTLAEKNRYAPWSGNPMSGEMDLIWNGRAITLRRFNRGATPFGGFEAVDTATGLALPELTGENCGEMLLGVGRETFQRTAFVGQSGVIVDSNPDLERRIAALVSSGEEDVSFSVVEKTLKNWKNRRKHNKTGLIPKLEEDLAQCTAQVDRLRQVIHHTAQAQAEWEGLELRRRELLQLVEAHRARQAWAKGQQYQQALEELTKARTTLTQVEQDLGDAPSKEDLLHAQGELNRWDTMEREGKRLEEDLRQKQEEVQQAKDQIGDAILAGRDPKTAWMTAHGDHRTALKKGAPTGAGVALILASLVALALLYTLGLAYMPAIAPKLALALPVPALLGVGILVTSLGRKRKTANILATYGVEQPQGILDWIGQSQEKVNRYQDRLNISEYAQAHVDNLSQERETCWADLLTFVQGFAPVVQDRFGVSAALSRALTLGDRLSVAQAKVSAAQTVLSNLGHAPAPVAGEPPVPPGSALEAAALLSAVEGELQRSAQTLALAQGEGQALGDIAHLEAQADALQTQLAQRKAEYTALEVALDALGQANNQLQARFSPALNQKAGEIFAHLTQQRYQSLTLTREFEATVRQEGQVEPRRALALSQGTIDQLYLAVRLAVCQMTLPESTPLVLDDALANFDDQRLATALTYLTHQEGQTLLFTCQSRENRWKGQAFAEG